MNNNTVIINIENDTRNDLTNKEILLDDAMHNIKKLLNSQAYGIELDDNMSMELEFLLIDLEQRLDEVYARHEELQALGQ